ncbi:hypothetical protein [Methanobrevibacter sp.]|uniref:hypothetical protein n=1 Tax=Methanobrevibacter sp. TaxID=66852 RepID=UPI003890A9FC
MVNENSKTIEINRLKSPLKYEDSKVYDSKGNQLACVETFSDLKYIVEPNAGVLSEEEILEHAPNSKEAARIRLSRGVGDNSDVLLINDSVPTLLGFYYTAAICLAIPAFYSGNRFAMFFILILFILPLAYLYYIFNLKQYVTTAYKTPTNNTQSKIGKTKKAEDIESEQSLQSLNKYVDEVEELRSVFDNKELKVRDLIAKRFEPPQMTYDRFMTTIDKSHDLFYHEADGAISIARYALEDTPRVESELESKIDTLKSIIDQIEDLTNELVINMSSEDKSGEDVKSLIDDMENLIDSVKEYK